MGKKFQAILDALKEGPGTAEELSMEVGLSPSACSAMLSLAYEAGMVQRKRHSVRQGQRGQYPFIYELS